MLGLKMIYLEAGSGATNPVPVSIIRAVRENFQFLLLLEEALKTRKRLKRYLKQVLI